MKIYLMLSPALPWRFKIGISRNVRLRAGQVGGFPIFSGSIWLAREFEAALHALYAPLNSPQKSDGGTEWFWIANPLAAYVAHRCGLDWWWFAFAPVPIDALGIVLAMWAVQRCAVVAAICSIFYLLAQ